MINGQPTSTDEARELAAQNVFVGKPSAKLSGSPTTTDEAREFARVANEDIKPTKGKAPAQVTNTAEAVEAARAK